MEDARACVSLSLQAVRISTKESDTARARAHLEREVARAVAASREAMQSAPSRLKPFKASLALRGRQLEYDTCFAKDVPFPKIYCECLLSKDVRKPRAQVSTQRFRGRRKDGLPRRLSAKRASKPESAHSGVAGAGDRGTRRGGSERTRVAPAKRGRHRERERERERAFAFPSDAFGIFLTFGNTFRNRAGLFAERSAS